MTHYYHEGGIAYPSVTTILDECLPKSPYLEQWRKNLCAQGIDPEKVTRRAQIVGTLAHYRCLSKLGMTTLEIPLDEVDECTPDILQDVEICDLMFTEILPTLNLGYPRQRETTVINREERYAGKFDLLAPSNDVLTLFDIKTSRSVYDTHLLQLGGYAAALWSNGVEVEQAAIITLHYKPENNPLLTGNVRWVKPDELKSQADEFIKIVRKYWADRQQDTEKATGST